MQQEMNFTGQQKRDRGIKRAIDNANDKVENWSGLAYIFLKDYIRTHKEFMAEQVRMASIGRVPDPPSKRAWGVIIVRAKKQGLIERVGFRNVTNSKAHCTPATVWKRKYEERLFE